MNLKTTKPTACCPHLLRLRHSYIFILRSERLLRLRVAGILQQREYIFGGSQGASACILLAFCSFRRRSHPLRPSARTLHHRGRREAQSHQNCPADSALLRQSLRPLWFKVPVFPGVPPCPQWVEDLVAVSSCCGFAVMDDRCPVVVAQ